MVLWRGWLSVTTIAITVLTVTVGVVEGGITLCHCTYCYCHRSQCLLLLCAVTLAPTHHLHCTLTVHCIHSIMENTACCALWYVLAGDADFCAGEATFSPHSSCHGTSSFPPIPPPLHPVPCVLQSRRAAGRVRNKVKVVRGTRPAKVVRK